MDKEFMLWLNKKLEQDRYYSLANEYLSECEDKEAKYLNIEHLSNFLQKNCLIKYEDS